MGSSLAGITVGFQLPYIILSRVDTVDTRLLSVALCSIYAQRSQQTKKKMVREKKPSKNKYTVLVVNPGSTSIKIAIYENEMNLYGREISYVVPH